MGIAIAFWLLAAAAVGSALAVVLLRNVFRAALLLISCFFAIAGLFVTLGADFLAMVQVLVYVGAIAVLLLLGIMLTREATRGSPFSRWHVGAAVASILLLVAMVSVLGRTNWKQVNNISVTVASDSNGQRFEPAEVTVVGGGTAHIQIASEDGVRHNFTVDELSINMQVPAGMTTSQDVKLDKFGTYTFYSKVGANREPGMQGKLNVVEAVRPTTAELGVNLLDPKRGFVLPFEIASLLLLAAVLGAIVLVKEKQ